MDYFRINYKKNLHQFGFYEKAIRFKSIFDSLRLVPPTYRKHGRKFELLQLAEIATWMIYPRILKSVFDLLQYSLDRSVVLRFNAY